MNIIIHFIDGYDSNLFWEFNLPDTNIVNNLKQEFKIYNKWIKKIKKGEAPVTSYVNEETAENLRSHKYPHSIFEYTHKFKVYNISDPNESYYDEDEKEFYMNKEYKEVLKFRDLKDLILDPYDVLNVFSIGYGSLLENTALLADEKYHGHI